MLDLDEGTREYLAGNPQAQAQLALVARAIAQIGLIGSSRHACPTCGAVDALVVQYRTGGQATCGGCGLRTTLADLMKDQPGEREQLARLMRARPRAR